MSATQYIVPRHAGIWLIGMRRLLLAAWTNLIDGKSLTIGVKSKQLHSNIMIADSLCTICFEFAYEYKIKENKKENVHDLKKNLKIRKVLPSFYTLEVEHINHLSKNLKCLGHIYITFGDPYNTTYSKSDMMQHHSIMYEPSYCVGTELFQNKFAKNRKKTLFLLYIWVLCKCEQSMIVSKFLFFSVLMIVIVVC